jgi:zinc/manganese transport system substrate-binding protein
MHWTKTLCLALAVALVVVASMAGGAERKLRVVTTIPDLTALAQAVGGDLADVETLTRGTQNAHEAEVRPTMMLKLRRADVLVENGLELEAWADVAVNGANNPNIVRGSAGRIDISRGLPILEVPTVRVDRSMGDVHPLGNPHYSLDPGFAPTITQNILEGFSRLAADGRPTFERNRQAFLDQLNEAMTRWTKTLEPFRGAKVVVYHPQWIYFLNRFGLVQAATLEDRPGIPASPGHLVRVIQQMKAERIKVIIVEPWNDRKLAERVAQEAGAKAIVLASMVGGVKGADSYIGAIDYNVNELSRALR